MASTFDGASWLDIGDQPDLHFLSTEVWCILLLFFPTVADQSSILAKWTSGNDGRQVDVGQGTGGTQARFRHNDNREVFINGGITLNEWNAQCASMDGANGMSLRTYRHSTRTLSSGSGTTNGNRVNMSEPVRLGNRNPTFPIEFTGTYAKATVLYRALTDAQFIHWATKPREATQLYRGNTCRLDIEPGNIDLATSMHVDTSNNRYNGTEVGTGIATVPGPPLPMARRLYQVPKSPVSGPPPVGNLAWLNSINLGEGFRHVA